MSILITGTAGFIGFHTALNLIKKKKKVIGIDNLNNYYSVGLKKNRLKILNKHKKYFKFLKIDLTENQKLRKIIREKIILTKL